MSNATLQRRGRRIMMTRSWRSRWPRWRSCTQWRQDSWLAPTCGCLHWDTTSNLSVSLTSCTRSTSSVTSSSTWPSLPSDTPCPRRREQHAWSGERNVRTGPLLVVETHALIVHMDFFPSPHVLTTPVQQPERDNEGMLSLATVILHISRPKQQPRKTVVRFNNSWFH